jgi:hypothetical protein
MNGSSALSFSPSPLRSTRASSCENALDSGYGAAQESNLPSDGLRRLTGFEDQLGHRARAAPLYTIWTSTS